MMPLPQWMNEEESIDDWRTSAWEHAERAPVA